MGETFSSDWELTGEGFPEEMTLGFSSENRARVSQVKAQGKEIPGGGISMRS